MIALRVQQQTKGSSTVSANITGAGIFNRRYISTSVYLNDCIFQRLQFSRTIAIRNVHGNKVTPSTTDSKSLRLRSSMVLAAAGSATPETSLKVISQGTSTGFGTGARKVHVTRFREIHNQTRFAQKRADVAMLR